MSPMKRSTNVAARMGRWSARHRKTAIFGWLALVVAAVVIGGAVGTKQLGDNDTLPGESGKAARILDDGFEQPASEAVLVQSSTLKADSPAFRAAVEDVVRRVSASAPSPTWRARSRPETTARSRPTVTQLSLTSTSEATRTRPSTRSTR